MYITQRVTNTVIAIITSTLADTLGADRSMEDIVRDIMTLASEIDPTHFIGGEIKEGWLYTYISHDYAPIFIAASAITMSPFSLIELDNGYLAGCEADKSAALHITLVYMEVMEKIRELFNNLGEKKYEASEDELAAYISINMSDIRVDIPSPRNVKFVDLDVAKMFIENVVLKKTLMRAFQRLKT